jgi:hypothetical protein
MLPQKCQKLFNSTALIALHVANNADFSRRGTVGKASTNQRRPILRVNGPLWKNCNTEAERHQRFDGGYLGASITNFGFKIVIATKLLDLPDKTAAST